MFSLKHIFQVNTDNTMRAQTTKSSDEGYGKNVQLCNGEFQRPLNNTMFGVVTKTENINDDFRIL